MVEEVTGGEQPRRGGRPATGKRGTFTFRVTDQLRNKLELAAAEMKRPVSEEIEARLERSFSDKDLIHRTLSSSKKWAKTLEMLGVVALVAQRRTDKDIDTDDDTFEVAIRAVEMLLSVNSAYKTLEERDAHREAVTEHARDVARLVHAIYHERDREALKKNLDLWARDGEGFA